MSRALVIAHLYPREMNIYGDMGNVITLVQRLVWRGYDAEVKNVEIGEAFDLSTADIVFGGGGQDSGQMIVGADLVHRGGQIREAATDGMPMLTICGLYQLFGRGFMTMDGRELLGIDVFKASTIGSTTRMIGNMVVHSPRYGHLVGFENHSGQTTLELGQESLGRVKQGYGNNERSHYEGAITGNAIGTYLHGPVLPKNPTIADDLILQALKRRYGVTELAPLDDRVELAAAKVASSRPR
jgi:CobQ-like glutamine amidotransferase family enzyme